MLARIDGPDGSYVEGPHLALFSAPTVPETGWTYRIVLRDLPDDADLSVAVDLVPDLDGTSSQQLTHDFPLPSERDPVRDALPYVLGGLLACWPVGRSSG